MELALKSFDTNAFGALRTARCVIPHMAKRKSGMIVNIGSIGAYVHVHHILIYYFHCYPFINLYCNSQTNPMERHILCLQGSFTLKYRSARNGVQALEYFSYSRLSRLYQVKSNIASNHEKACSELPENSLYRSYIPQIIERMRYSQRLEATPTEEFAKQLADKLIARMETGKGGELIIL